MYKLYNRYSHFARRYDKIMHLTGLAANLENLVLSTALSAASDAFQSGKDLLQKQIDS